MTQQALQHNIIRSDWLDRSKEEAIEPELPIIDTHHHLFDKPENQYLMKDLLADIDSGHKVIATVYVQGRAKYREHGPEEMKPIGETEFANQVAKESQLYTLGKTTVCAGIVGFTDFRQADKVRPILEAHIAAAGGSIHEGGRFRGIRQSSAWDQDSTFLNPAYQTSENMFEDADFLTGFAHLAPLGLMYETWQFFHQIPKLTQLARRFPETKIVLNHCGGILGVRRYANAQEKVFSTWRTSLEELAKCPNVYLKLSGLGMKISGFKFEQLEQGPSSDQLVQQWRPWVESCLELFGSERCMYGSNFPVDKGSYAYGNGLNAIKKIVQQVSHEDKQNIFWRTANTAYQLHISTT